MNRPGLLLLLLIGFPALMPGIANAQDSKLDAPVSRQPTVGSEINRGDDAGLQCALHAVTNFSHFEDCISNVVRDNRQKSTLSEPFEFGLYAAALQQAQLIYKVPNSESFVSSWRDRMIKIMKTRKLSFTEYCKSTARDVKKCTDHLKPFFEAIAK